MKTPRILWAIAILTLWMGSQTMSAPAAWTLDQLNPFQNRKKPAKETGKKASPLKTLSDGTKKFFSNVKNAITPKKSAAQKSPLKPHTPWGRKSKAQEYRTAKKPSWLGSFFRRVEPEPPQTMDEWMDLESPKP